MSLDFSDFLMFFIYIWVNFSYILSEAAEKKTLISILAYNLYSVKKKAINIQLIRIGRHHYLPVNLDACQLALVFTLEKERERDKEEQGCVCVTEKESKCNFLRFKTARISELASKLLTWNSNMKPEFCKSDLFCQYCNSYPMLF